jgi:hypothetical protein
MDVTKSITTDKLEMRQVVRNNNCIKIPQSLLSTSGSI